MEPSVFSRMFPPSFFAQAPTRPYVTFELNPTKIQRLVVKTWLSEYGLRQTDLDTHDHNAGPHGLCCFGFPPEETQGSEQLGGSPSKILESILSSDVIRCHTDEWTFAEPYEDDERHEVQKWFKSLVTSYRTRVAAFPAPNQAWEDSLWKLEVLVYSKRQEQSLSPSSQPSYQSHQSQAASKNGYRRTTKVLEPVEITRLKQQVLRNAIQNHPYHANFWDAVECRLLELYEQAKAIENFNQAIEIAEIAAFAAEGCHSRRCPWLNRLGDELGNRFKRGGPVDDLNRAVELAETAVNFTIDYTPPYPGLLNTLASRLCHRYDYTGSIADIDRAIDKTKMAVERTSRKNPDKHVFLVSLAERLGTRFERTGSKTDIDKAIKYARKVVKNTPYDHTDRAKRLSILGILLLSRYELTGSMEDLDNAVKHAGSSAKIATPEQPEYPAIQGNLEVCLFTRSIRKKSLGDLDQPINVLKTIVENISQTDPRYPKLLFNLGSYHAERFKNSNADQDLKNSFAFYKQGLHCVNTPPSVRVRLAHAAAEVLALDSRWNEASDLLDEAVALLPAISTRLLGDLDKQLALADATGLATFAAAAALNAGKGAEHALGLLELGRGVIASGTLETRTSIMDLEDKYPVLASEFESFRDKLESPPPTQVLAFEWETQSKERHELHSQFRSTCDKIRSLPGFENFLLPPNASELRAAASLGPIIVINTNKYRCDALLVRAVGIQLLRLHDLRYTDFGGKVQVTSKLLKQLWEKIACPILTELGFLQKRGDGPTVKLPRVWWVLTGSLSRFPIHAAGLPCSNSMETVLDQVVSSYCSSIKTLLHARQESKQRIPESAMLVSMSTTPPFEDYRPSDLAFARREVEMLKRLLPRTILRTEFDKPRKREVMRGVEDCSIFHFAGHGISHLGNPSKSSLLLEDWGRNPLTVKDLTSLAQQERAKYSGYRMKQFILLVPVSWRAFDM
ncbi:hypothetical protein CEP53_001101 [Fusarium sp. AF-6]|nr:hypothetical protein CEP53_001101 [Fusarium sp. AF-6]